MVSQNQIVGSEAFNRFWSNVQTTIEDATESPSTTSYVLTADKWTGTQAPYKYELTVLGVTADNVVMISLSNTLSDAEFDAQYTVNLKAEIRRVTQGPNKLTFIAYGEKPTASLKFDIAVL